MDHVALRGEVLATESQVVVVAQHRPDATLPPIETPAPTSPTRRALPWIAASTAAVVAAVVILHAGQGLGFYWGEWDWIQHRRTGSLDDYLEPHNGHLVAVGVVVYKFVYALLGLDHYTTYRVAVLVAHLGCALLFFVYARRRSTECFAVAGTVVLLFLGTAWQDLLWPFQVQYLFAIAGGLGALLLLDLQTRAADLGASAALLAAVASSGVGLPFLGAVGFELLLRRTTWRRLWVPLVPLVLYGIWYLAYGESQARASNVDLVPSYAARGEAASIGALFGTTMDSGRYLIGGFVVLVLAVLVQRRTVSLRLATTILLTTGFWVLTALGRAHNSEPNASRYLYPGAMTLLLVMTELITLIQWPRRRAAVAIGVAALVVVVAVSLRGNIRDLDRGGDALQGVSEIARVELAALELLGDRVPDDFRPAFEYAPQVVAGPYLDAVRDLGSPALSLRQLQQSPDMLRARANGVLLRGLGVAPVPSDPFPVAVGTPLPTARVEGRLARESECVVLVPDAPGETASLEISGRSPVLRIEAGRVAPVDVGIRSFADSLSAPTTPVPPGKTMALVVPAFRNRTWTVRLSTTDSVRVCSAVPQPTTDRG